MLVVYLILAVVFSAAAAVMFHWERDPQGAVQYTRSGRPTVRFILTQRRSLPVVVALTFGWAALFIAAAFGRMTGLPQGLILWVLFVGGMAYSLSRHHKGANRTRI